MRYKQLSESLLKYSISINSWSTEARNTAWCATSYRFVYRGFHGTDLQGELSHDINPQAVDCHIDIAPKAASVQSITIVFVVVEMVFNYC